ncbi:MAG: endonuclease/exonuclease/phosphatase family protein [Deltaproteobacteria bacterium]|nr:endonuclease/exonuclease/phosphatase family protein [Deltaproteobacteria bacterium]
MITRHALVCAGGLALGLLAGCTSEELGQTQPWTSAADITGPLSPETAPVPGEVAFTAPMRLRVVTYNVHKGEDVAGLASAILGNPNLATADIFLLQEIEHHPGEGGCRAARLAALLGMGHVYAPERLQGDGTHGTAILSRYPLENPRVMALPQADLVGSGTRRIALYAEAVVGAVRLHLVDVHLDTRLNATDRILQLRPAVLDTPWPTVVAGDLNTNPYLWADSFIPQLAVGSVADSDQAPVLDDYMRHIDFTTPTARLGATWSGVVDARLDAIFTRGVTAVPGAVERGVTMSDHWPVWVDIVLP